MHLFKGKANDYDALARANKEPACRSAGASKQTCAHAMLEVWSSEQVRFRSGGLRVTGYGWRVARVTGLRVAALVWGYVLTRGGGCHDVLLAVPLARTLSSSFSSRSIKKTHTFTPPPPRLAPPRHPPLPPLPVPSHSLRCGGGFSKSARCRTPGQAVSSAA
jgi:hypothetical protein